MDDTVVRFVANPSHQNKWKEFTKYLLKNWFNLANINFIGSHSNYHKELLYNETPQMTNNPAESLNRVLKSNYDAGRISRSDLAEGLHNFFHARRLKMQVFLNGEKTQSRNLCDIKKWQKQKFLAQFVQAALENSFDPDFQGQVLYEAAYKHGRIYEDNINQIYSDAHPAHSSHITIPNI